MIIKYGSKKGTIGKNSRLFLIEMILTLLFFCISGAVIMTVFASAAGRMQKNDLTDNAVLCAQSCAEVYSVTGSVEEMAMTVFGSSCEKVESTYRIGLDRDFRPSDSAAVVLILNEKRSDGGSGTLGSVTAEFIHNDSTLYSLTFSAYIPDNGGESDE